MRETIRDFTLGVAALAALFAAFQSWTTGRELTREMTAVREELAEMRGQLQTITDVLLAHINAPGLHGGED